MKLPELPDGFKLLASYSMENGLIVVVAETEQVVLEALWDPGVTAVYKSFRLFMKYKPTQE